MGNPGPGARCVQVVLVAGVGGCVGVRKLRTHCALAGPLRVCICVCVSVCVCLCV